MGRPGIKLKIQDSEDGLKRVHQRSTCAVERRRLQVISSRNNEMIVCRLSISVPPAQGCL